VSRVIRANQNNAGTYAGSRSSNSPEVAYRFERFPKHAECLRSGARIGVISALPMEQSLRLDAWTYALDARVEAVDVGDWAAPADSLRFDICEVAAPLNGDGDCDRTVISQGQNLEEHRGLRTHIA
jgi:hypothetical protein